MFDVILECIRAAILLYLLLQLITATRKRTDIQRKGWNCILAGFSLLLFANIMDITDNIESLNRFVIIGDTPIQAILEKIVGYSAGFLLLTIGLIKWLQTMTTRNMLQSSERKFRLAFETSGVGMVMAAMDGRLIKVNKSFCKMTGYSQDELLNRDIISLTHPDDIEISNIVINNLISGLKVHDSIEKKYIHKDRSIIWAIINVSIVTDENGKPSHFVSQISDITKRKETENMLIIQKNRADKMAAKALSANKGKSQFLASMSHEIRTPMNSIIGFSDILAEEVSSDDHKEYVEHIQNSGNHLLQLINDILDYSKIEAGKMDVDISFSSLQDIIDNVDSMMRPFAEAKNLDFVFTKSPDVPEKIRTDPTRVEQCLINLVNNAIKFTDQGHVKVNTSFEIIDSKEFVCIDVEDTGIGISPKAQQKIFDSFTQADQGTAKKMAGTGLGLAITKQLAELLGGTVRLASKQAEGSTFSILIPVGRKRKDQSTDNDLQYQNTQQNEKLQLSGKCLVAEDEAANQHLMKILLEKMGLSVTLANSPEEAVEKTENTQFDMIFIDLPSVAAKPGTLEKIRENTHQTPIIALTANPILQEDYTICDKCLQKPISQKKLEETAKDYITKKLIANG